LRLYEFQAKRIFAKYGIPIPKGDIADSPFKAKKISEELGVPVAIKAQVLAGGRGLAGGIKFANNPEQTYQIANEMLGKKFKREIVKRLLIEEKIQIDKEYFAGITIDYQNRCPLLIASSKGGVDIESIAKEHPTEIAKQNIDLDVGLTDFQARRIAKKVGLRGKYMLSFSSILKSLYNIMLNYDASLVEVNPLALTRDRSFIAVDAKIILDEHASFRHQDFYSKIYNEFILKEDYEVRKNLAKKAGIPTYIELEGNIGIIADGAGSGMLTLDLIKELGGEVETYCELGGRTSPQLIEKAMKIVLSNENVTYLLINLIGGLNRMDEMAEGIISFITKNRNIIQKRGIEIIIRMTGTLEEKGREMLTKFGINTFDDIYDAIERIVKLSRGN